ncbi:ImcF-related family protein [Photorhabdus noenieputensis]|uniref:ImcF-related family protein n=2 Tax=Photorhabdus noenieputensis TaxID=1208607 RepID=UPI0020006379|nr:ImcF-related family protein [Photorhabdus noenieputensis]MCK3668974.1 type VI secretion protein VasK [Photorhabdus noenieputensis]
MISNKWIKIGNALLFIVVAAVSAFCIWFYGEKIGLDTNDKKIFAWGLAVLIFSVLRLFPVIVGIYRQEYLRREIEQQGMRPAREERLKIYTSEDEHREMINFHLSRRYGRFWRNKVRILLVMGEDQEVDQIAPGLVQQKWQEGEHNLLLWGGSLQVQPDKAQLQALRQLRRRRPLDGVVWAMSEDQLGQRTQIETALRMLEKQGRQLGWQAPVYVWNVRHSDWDQRDRPTQTVGCFLSGEYTPEMLAESLNSLIPTLANRGMEQAIAENRHDFLLRLAQSLRDEGVTRLVRQLTPLLDRPPIKLSGVTFSLPLPVPSGMVEHGWLVEASWGGVLEHVRDSRGQAVGFPWEKSAQWSVIALAALWGVGSVTSFWVNRHQIAVSRERISAASDRQGDLSARLLSQHGLQREIDRLQSQSERGAPWYSRFGFNQNEALLKAMWPVYQRNNAELIRDAAARLLHQRLTELVNLPAGSAQRHQRIKSAYDQLKVYLMMARPEKADATVMSRVLMADWPHRAGVTDGLWQNSGEALLTFYAENLPRHPEWKISVDNELVSEVRQILLNQLGQRHAETMLYQKMLQQVAHSYGDLTLAQMTGATEASRLFTTRQVVPGMFTRQAWEGQVQKAIAQVVASRQEEIDWVLSDGRQPVLKAVSPAELKARLTARYFTDFAGAWLNFLNSLRWHKTHNLSDTIDQLTLMADVRQSPLIALMDTLAYQGEAGQPGAALADSLVKSAQNLFQNNKPSVIDQTRLPPGPLDNAFGPLLALMGQSAAENGLTADPSLSLQTFLTRVTRVRLALQQLANTDDPPAVMEALAQSVFQGKSVELTDTRTYGSLIAASLGAEWNGFGQAVFVQPLTEAWQTVLQPAAASLNEQWQSAVVADWQTDFDGRYPFVAGQNEVSLPMLGQFIRADSGRIEQFLHSQLGGVLHKEGKYWVVDKVNSQGLHVNPAFLTAINQLGQVADVLFANGSEGIRFELRAKPVGDVAETDLTIDGQRLRYFNQRESWQRLRWPGDEDNPGVALTWTGVNTGARLYGDYPGAWGLMRWLEAAQVKMLDESRYRLTFTTPEGLPLTWVLRTEVGKGPLALLKLRGFRLPKTIFVENTGNHLSEPERNNDDWENE